MTSSMISVVLLRRSFHRFLCIVLFSSAASFSPALLMDAWDFYGFFMRFFVSSENLLLWEGFLSQSFLLNLSFPDHFRYCFGLLIFHEYHIVFLTLSEMYIWELHVFWIFSGLEKNSFCLTCLVLKWILHLTILWSLPMLTWFRTSTFFLYYICLLVCSLFHFVFHGFGFSMSISCLYFFKCVLEAMGHSKADQVISLISLSISKFANTILIPCPILVLKSPILIL